MSCASPQRLLLVCASLRAGSLNAQLLQAVQRLLPAGLLGQQAPSLANLPLYNEDLDTEPAPPAVQAWRDAIAASAGLLIATPEYNHGMPGVLKNAIDWASRPYGAPALCGKVIAVMVATPGRRRGYLALQQSHSILADMGNFVVAAPQVTISEAPGCLRADGQGQMQLSCATAERLVLAQLQAVQQALACGAGSASAAGIRHFGR